MQVVTMSCAIDDASSSRVVLWVGVTKEKTLVRDDGLARETLQRHREARSRDAHIAQIGRRHRPQ